MAARIFIVCTLISVCLVVAEGRIGLSHEDARLLDGLGTFFWYRGIGVKQYAVVSLNGAGKSNANSLKPCFKSSDGKYINKAKMFGEKQPSAGSKWNYWVRLRQKYPDPVKHAEKQIFDQLPNLVMNLGQEVKSIHLFTRLSPCMKCTKLIKAFAIGNRGIKVYVGYRVLYENKNDTNSGQKGLNYATQQMRPLTNVFFAQIDTNRQVNIFTAEQGF